MKKRPEIFYCCLFRSGLGSLRRGIGKTSSSELAGGQRKTKAAMIWKKGWKGWKKLHSFGNNSNKTGESFVPFVTSVLYHAIQIIIQRAFLIVVIKIF